MKHLYLLSFFVIFFLSCTKQTKKGKKSNNIFYDRAFDYLKKGVSDSAFLYFNEAKDLFLQQKDSLSAGKCLIHMSIILTDKGDYYGAQEVSLNAIAFFDKKKKDQSFFIHSNFNTLGMATHKLKNYEDALRFYDSAIEFGKDPKDIRLYLNNKARTYQELKEYKLALKIYNQILKGTSKNKREYARTLTNISSTKWLQNPHYNPIPDYLKALSIRKDEKDLWGQNSSYTHLAEYYAKEMSDSALFYANKRYEITKEINSPDDRLDALKVLIELSPSKLSKQYFEAYRNLNDSLQNARNVAKNQFALIRYETEKHKTDFLKAQAENVQKQNDILRRNIVLGILASSLIAGYWWYRKRKKGLQQEKELEVKNTEIKYVKKIHDRVANKVYQVMSEVENTPKLDRDLLLDKLEVLYHISRDISYESKELNTEIDYAQQLTRMLRSYASDVTEVFVITNDDELWKGIDSNSKTEVYYVLQELMTNMSKHSKAESVVIKFQRNQDHISISYHDNGIGMKEELKKNGLTNTGTRINSIGGTIKFESISGKELNIQISFPFSQKK